MHVANQSYGKSRVRLTRVTRKGDRHFIIELTADIRLDGDFNATYETGDNSSVVPTDTMKNTVYALAKRKGAPDIETFAQTLARHFTQNFDQVDTAHVRLTERPWKRLVFEGVEHPHAFLGTSSERATCAATATGSGSEVQVVSGIQDLVVLKTTGSGFVGYVKDEFTSLKETEDRILATNVAAEWSYRNQVGGPVTRIRVREVILKVFAEQHSLSVQQTLHSIGAAVLNACPEIEAITLDMPNLHRLLVDLSPFEMDNENEIFLPVDEPHGTISATITRDGTS
ncbi:MAG: urate oxidase [Pirellulales bacterium]